MQNRPDFIKCLKKGGSEKAISELKTFMRIELTNIENDEDLEEEEYLLYIEKVELANFALKLARKLLRKKGYPFSGIFETLIESNSQTIPIVLNIASYCFPQSGIASTSQEINTILSFKTRQKLENDEDFYYASHICDNILEGVAVSGTSRNIDGFWPLTQYLLKHKSINKQWIAQSCLSASLAIIDRFPERQYHFFDELLTLIVEELELEIKLEKARDMKKLENIMENFMSENKVALIYKNDTRNTIFKFLQYFLEMDLKVDMFVNWIVKISSFSDVEISRRRCLAVMELCVKKSSLQHAYLDILVSVMKICKITIAGNSMFRQFESSEARSSENFLQELSKVVHPDAQSFAKKLLPSPDVLWAKLRSNEVSKVSVVRNAIIIGSCHFLNSEDDKKQIIPILLLTCLNELREKFGQKWDKFRLHISGSSNKTLSDLSEFTDPILMTDENLKIDALKCALLIDKKPRQLMQLVADMTISIISKGNLLEIEKILPFLRVFFEENPASSTDIVKEIMIFLSKNVAQNSSAIFRVIQEYPGDIEMELDVIEKLVENYSNSPDFLKVLLKLSQIPPKVFEKIEISLEEKIFIEIWEKFANGIVDIDVLNKVFEKEKGQKFAGFVENINMSNLAEEVKVTVYSTLGAHFVIKDDLTNLHSLIGILNKNHIFEKISCNFRQNSGLSYIV
ncbi:unnamed protein product [Caenorhabditis angaria]|uniref:Uncharacterized protein n=1 Tax=Caenorhabditis angaria TaxID=860376 RepID=A0A9P1MS86_9PELO|nr:unnamed protein product [Caenorhabditis angaria]